MLGKGLMKVIAERHLSGVRIQDEEIDYLFHVINKYEETEDFYSSIIDLYKKMLGEVID